jgi:hypothetical protein
MCLEIAFIVERLPNSRHILRCALKLLSLLSDSQTLDIYHETKYKYIGSFKVIITKGCDETNLLRLIDRLLFNVKFVVT